MPLSSHSVGRLVAPVVLCSYVCQRAVRGEAHISMMDFKQRMMDIYASPEDAFEELDASPSDVAAALDAKPVRLDDFIRGTKTFNPPLSEDEARTAFAGLDANHDGAISLDEFTAVVASGHFGTLVSSSAPPTKTATLRETTVAAADRRVPITMADFKTRLLEVYDSLEDAFAEMDASASDLDAALDELPLDLQEFTHGTSMFKKPLTKEQAEFVFDALDTNHDQLLESAEFTEGVNSGGFPSTTRTTSQTLTLTTSTVTTITTSTFTSTVTTYTTSQTSTQTTTQTSTTQTTTLTTTSTQTTTTSSTTTTTPLASGSSEGTITMTEFQRCMLSAYSSPEAAFKELEANPADVHDFIRVVRTFDPPLSEEQAKYAFKGLDADHDQLLVSTEFLSILTLGHFFPTEVESQNVFPSTSTTTTTFLLLVHAPRADPTDNPGWRWPVPLSLAYLCLGGYLARSAFVALRLPGLAGVLLSGAVFEFFAPGSVHPAADKLQELVFFVALFCTGLQLSLEDLSFHVVVSALLPAALELVAISFYGMAMFGCSLVEGLALGTVLFAVGDSIVVPKMDDLGRRFPGHHTPRLVFLSAPLEACFALVVFGVLASLSAPTGKLVDVSAAATVVRVARVVVSLGAGAAAGYLAGKLVPQRTRVKTFGRTCFTGTALEGALLAASAALASFGLGGSSLTCKWVSPGLQLAPILQPELLVVLMAVGFAAAAGPADLEGVENVLGGVWMLGQLVLFGLFGCGTQPGLLGELHRILPMMAVGLLARFVGILLASGLTLASRPCSCPTCRKADRSSFCGEALFCFLASMPRASVQGVLGTLPVSSRVLLAGAAGNGQGAQTLISAAATLYVLSLSILGSCFLDLWGTCILRDISGRERCEASVAREAQLSRDGWTARQRARAQDLAASFGGTFKLGLVSEDEVLFEDADAPAFPIKEAAHTLARLYSADANVFAQALEGAVGGRQVAGTENPDGTSVLEELMPSSEKPPPSYTALTTNGLDTAHFGDGTGEPGPVKTCVCKAAHSTKLPLTGQLEMDGVSTEDSPVAAPHSSALRL